MQRDRCVAISDDNYRHIIAIAVVFYLVENDLAVGRVGAIAYRLELAAPRVGPRQIGRDTETNAAGDPGGQAEAQRPAILEDQAPFAKRRLEAQQMRVRRQREWLRLARAVDQAQVRDKRRAVTIGRKARCQRGEALRQLNEQGMRRAPLAVDQQARATIAKRHTLDLDPILQQT